MNRVPSRPSIQPLRCRVQGDVPVEAGGDRSGKDVPEVERDDVGGHEIDLHAPFREFPGSDVTGEHAIRMFRRYRYTRGPVV